MTIDTALLILAICIGPAVIAVVIAEAIAKFRRC